MAIGAAWAEIWNEAIWGPVWSQDAPEPPEPETTTQTPAGKSRKRVYVQIDGNQFDVRSAEEAVQILNQARALAEQKAERAAASAERNVKRIAKRTGVVPQLEIKRPEITVSHEIKAETKAVLADIQRLYDRAATIAELRILLAEKLAREDEEDAELLLLL